jgi:DNA repair protein RecN (Recombination protein N)
MLKELLIKNFAIIDDLNIRFEGGLTILSGETGAGKSIIINAVNLLLGSRVNARMIRDGHVTAELSAYFDIFEGSPAAAIMAENGYAPENGLLVRRIIAGNNRHRIYINDRMATLQTLATITANLASISSQHAHQGLIREETHLAILDRFGGLTPQARQVSDLYATVVPLIQALHALKEKQKNQKNEMDLLRYQAAEIADADIMPGEDESLEKERLKLKHAESIQQSVFSAVESLHGADGAILEKLGEVRKELEKTANMDDELRTEVRCLSDHLFGLEDLTETLRAYLGNIDTQANRLESVETRLDLINKLKRKYGGSLETLSQKSDAIRAELATIGNIEDDIERSETQLKDYCGQLANLSRRLSAERKEVAAVFARSVEKELEGLRMAGTRFRVSLSPLPFSKPASPWLRMDDNLLSATGIDQAAFMIAPNVGESLKPLASIASGGELSRIILALKAILAKTDAVATIIFDEVDAGIGGAAANDVGKKLKVLSIKHQLICITHLPQIARFADQHYYIEKQVKNGRTVTTIRPMAKEERVKEIARMLGGETVTRTALKHARNLIEH